MRVRRSIVVGTGVCLAVVAGLEAAGTSFTYQGRLRSSGQALNGTYEFEFRLFSTPAGAGPLATAAASAELADGLFTAVVSFPDASLFNGQARWLEIAVRPESDQPVAYETLSPRTPITPTPYAEYALSAAGLRLPFAGTSNSHLPALSITSTGTGSSLAAVQSGTGQGAFSTIINPASESLAFGVLHEGRGMGQYVELASPANPSTALSVKTNGTGAAGQFLISNSSSGAPALQAGTTGSGPAAVFNGEVGIGADQPEAALHMNTSLAPATIRFEAERYLAEPPAFAAGAPAMVSQVLATGTASWFNVTGALSEDAMSAGVLLTRSESQPAPASHFLDFTNLGMGLPAGAQITGIRVVVRGNATGTCQGCSGPMEDAYARVQVGLIHNNQQSAEVRTVTLRDTEEDKSVGTDGVLWGGNWTSEMVNAASFGVRLVATPVFQTSKPGWFPGSYQAEECSWCTGNVTALVDNLRVTIIYRPASVVTERVNWIMGVPQDQKQFQISPTGDFSVPTVAFDANGQAFKPGGGSWSGLSDARLKKNIEPLAGTLDRLLSLHGYSFEYLPEAVRHKMALPGRQIGLVSQEVEQVFPEWVHEDSEGFKYVTERAITALMVEALRDLRAEKECQVESLRADAEALRAEVGERDRRIRRLEQAHAELEARLQRIEARLRAETPASR